MSTPFDPFASEKSVGHGFHYEKQSSVITPVLLSLIAVILSVNIGLTVWWSVHLAGWM